MKTWTRLGLATGAVVVLAASAVWTIHITDTPLRRAASAANRVAATCTPAVLPVPATLGTYDEIVAAVEDPTGRYTVVTFARSVIDDPLTAMVRWDRGTPSILPQPVPDAVATGINASGTVVGDSWTGHHPGWMLTSGTSTLLPDLADIPVQALGINAGGDIIGSAGSVFAIVHAGDPTSAVALAGQQSDIMPQGVEPGVALADDGTIVGTIDDHAYIWPAHGSPHHLAGPGDQHSEAVGITGAWVVGLTRSPPAKPTAAVWNVATGTVTLTREPAVLLSSISAGGVAVGEQINGDEGTEDGVTVINGNVAVLPLPTGATTGFPEAITVDGRTISGYARTGTTDMPVLWHC